MNGTKKITIGILAHVDAGKTTLSEAILYKTGEIRKPGRVDHGDTFLDDSEILPLVANPDYSVYMVTDV